MACDGLTACDLWTAHVAACSKEPVGRPCVSREAQKNWESRADDAVEADGVVGGVGVVEREEIGSQVGGLEAEPGGGQQIRGRFDCDWNWRRTGDGARDTSG